MDVEKSLAVQQIVLFSGGVSLILLRNAQTWIVKGYQGVGRLSCWE